jgi:hypothetical protein
MNTLIRTFAVAVFTALALAPGLAAQTPASGRLTAAQVTQLISRGEPADHARLRAHFSALADQDAADAKRHTTMQQEYAGSTKIVAVSMRAHCKELIGRSQQSAANLRELSAYHGNLAGGATVEPPRVTAQPGTPTDAELARLAGKAETAADHRTLESYFASLATRYEREAADHAAYAKTWTGLTRVTGSAGQAAAHDREATLRRAAAAEARAAASMHKDEAAKAK